MKTCKNCVYYMRESECSMCRRFYKDDDPELKDKWKEKPKFKGLDFVHEVD